MNDEQRINLIEKYLEGDCTEAERLELEQWFDGLSNDDKVFYQNEPDKISLAAKRSMLAIRTKIGLKETPVIQLKTKRRLSYAVAASILLCCSIGLYFYKLETQKQVFNIEVAKKIDIAPGSNGAILTLANGQKIVLEQTKAGAVIHQNGTELRKAGDSLLVYHAGTPAVNETSYNTLETPKGKQYAVLLPDGSKVWLNAASSLKYPTTFSGTQRLVEMTGEAYFEVVHNSRMPFRVKTGNQVVEDVGTEFNISAYAEEAEIRTTLIAGSIKINKGGQNKLLRPGEQAVNSADNERIRITNVDTEPAVAWKNGDFIFKDEDFKTAMRQLARWYNVEVIYDASAPLNFIPGGWVSRSNNISAILNIMESTGKVHFKVEGRRVTVTK